MSNPAAPSAARVKAHEDRKRSAGMVQRKRWAHPDDWPLIDQTIQALADRRSRDRAQKTG